MRNMKVKRMKYVIKKNKNNNKKTTKMSNIKKKRLRTNDTLMMTSVTACPELPAAHWYHQQQPNLYSLGTLSQLKPNGFCLINNKISIIPNT